MNKKNNIAYIVFTIMNDFLKRELEDENIMLLNNSINEIRVDTLSKSLNTNWTKERMENPFIKLTDDELSVLELFNKVRDVMKKGEKSYINSEAYSHRYVFNVRYKDSEFIVNAYTKDHKSVLAFIFDKESNSIKDVACLNSKTTSIPNLSKHDTGISRANSSFNKHNSKGAIAQTPNGPTRGMDGNYYLAKNPEDENIVMSNSVLRILYITTKGLPSKMTTRKHILNSIFYDYDSDNKKSVIEAHFNDGVHFQKEFDEVKIIPLSEYRLIMQLANLTKLLRLAFVPKARYDLLRTPGSPFFNISTGLRLSPYFIGNVEIENSKFLNKKELKEVREQISIMQKFLTLEASKVEDSFTNQYISSKQQRDIENVVSKSFDILERIQISGEN